MPKSKVYCFFILCLWVINTSNAQIITAAEQTAAYLPLIKNKRIALVVNQTSCIKSTHLVDTLLSLGIKIKCLFAPEHGFRGNR